MTHPRWAHLALFLLLASLASRAQAAWKLDPPDHPPATWGYQPDTPAEPVNPPAFTWRPAPGAVHYELKVCESLAADRVVYRAQRILWSSHVPAVALPEKLKLYWIFRAYREPDGWSEWSRPLEFEVAPGAVPQPKPDERDLAGRIPKTHPRLFLRPDTLDSLRKRLKTDLAPMWQTAVKQAEDVLSAPPDTSEPPLYPEGTVVKSEEWKEIWWGNRKRAIAVTEAAAKCAFVYRMRLDKRFGMAAHDLLMAFAEWDPKGSTQYDYNDEAAMPLLYWPARTYTWAQDCFTPEEREKIVAVMRVRGEDCYKHLRQQEHLWRPYNSHANRAWHKLAELAIAFHSEIPEAREWLDYAMTIYYSCYPVWGGNDGAWHEGVSYWQSYMSRFQYWGVTMKTSLDLDPFDKPFFRETGYYPMYTMPPGSSAGAWGDLAQGASPKGAANVVGIFARASGKADWAWYAEASGFDLASLGWFGVVTGALLEQSPSAAPAELPPSRVFPDTGLAVFNTDLLDGTKNIQVHFKSSPWGTQSHGYNANNSFMLYVHGAPLLTLTGKRDVYGSPHHSKWMWHSKSDNVVLINDASQPKHTSRSLGRITQWELADGVDRVEGDASGAYAEAGQTWIRRLYFFKPELLLIHDHLTAPAPATYQWLLHSMGAFTLRENGAATSAGDASADVEFLHPAGLQISQSDQFDPPPHAWSKIDLKQWHLRAAVEEARPAVDFVTAIRVNGATPEVSAVPVDEGYRMSVTLNGGAKYQFDSKPGAPLSLALTPEAAPAGDAPAP